jgi:hypothetical protein
MPEELKKDVPATMWDKILASTPVVMTIVATLLAGLASSEMTTAQYERALGAQLQSKAGDQWGYFQAKKLRGAMLRNSSELLEATAKIRPSGNPALENIPAPPPRHADANVETALAAVEKQRPEAEVAQLLKKVEDGPLAAALQAAKERAIAFEAENAPAMHIMDQVETFPPSGEAAAAPELVAARMRHNGARYDGEAGLIQSVAYLYELHVRKANISAERHHRRSEKFFFGMLAAQAAVLIATFALAAQRRNFLWALAASAGTAAISFAIYVYVQV